MADQADPGAMADQEIWGAMADLPPWPWPGHYDHGNMSSPQKNLIGQN